MGDYGPVDGEFGEYGNSSMAIATGQGFREMRRAKVLMLHGNAESGSVFQSKSRFIKALLERTFPTFPEPGFNPMFPGGVELFYPTAPHRIRPACWTKADDHGSYSEKQKDFDSWTWAFGDYWKDEVVGYEQSVRHMMAVMKKEGPFDGIVGFSAGAGMALTLVSLSERRGTGDPKFMEALAINPEDIPPPFQFAVCCSGFIMHHPRYRSLYYPKIQTPILIFIGSFDPIVPEKHTLKFARRCANAVTVYHPGTHYVPKGKQFQEMIFKFITGIVRTDSLRSPDSELSLLEMSEGSSSS